MPHIITSSIEHPAVLEPIKYLERVGKVRVTYLPVYEDGIVKVKDVREALCEDTILVSVMYANNEIGVIQPLKEIGKICKFCPLCRLEISKISDFVAKSFRTLSASILGLFLG